jgi:hypothetical protein
MPSLRKLLRGGSPADVAALSGVLSGQAVGDYSLTIQPGFARA